MQLTAFLVLVFGFTSTSLAVCSGCFDRMHSADIMSATSDYLTQQAQLATDAANAGDQAALDVYNANIIDLQGYLGELGAEYGNSAECQCHEPEHDNENDELDTPPEENNNYNPDWNVFPDNSSYFDGDVVS